MSLTAENLSFAYKKKGGNVLRNITCSFEQGVFYGIFGANGSGKSTLLKLLAGELMSHGAVRLDNKQVNAFSNRERARHIAVGAQGSELILPFTVRETIRLGRYVWDDDGSVLIDRLLQEWASGDLAERPFAELSGGEQQRVKLLRVLAQDTDYILLDEPAAALDWNRQLELYEKLQKIAHGQNKCVIMVCHDLYSAPDFIDRMLLLKDGSLIYSGTADSDLAKAAVAQAFGRSWAKSAHTKLI